MKMFIVIGIGLACLSAHGATVATDGSVSDISAKIAAASAGDILTVPAGTYSSYGAGATQVTVNKRVTIQGAGSATTIFSLASDASYPFAIVSGGDGAVLKGFTVNQAGRTILQITDCNGWRVTDVKLVDPLSGSHPYQFYIENAEGLFDHCTFTMFTEQGIMRGPTDAWQTADKFGTTNAVYFEDCTFDGADGGYVDANANTRVVWRFNTISSKFKFDTHGKWSNTPSRSARHCEIYSNVWNNADGNWAAMELRGGGGMVFGNRAPNTGSPTTYPWLIMQEYYVVAMEKSAADYPIDDQIGVGIDPKSAAGSPMYHWGNVRGASTRWDWEIYNTSMAGVIDNDRDVFKQNASFDGSSGVGSGTVASMNAITPSLSGVGFWVTDEGEWNAANAGADGRLYTWNGSAWVLKYTPLVYPHPLQNAVPSGVSRVTRLIVGR